jgi:osmotically-inducible protein OsmY
MKQLIGLATAFTLILSSSVLFAMDNGIDDASITKNVQAKITSETNIATTVVAPHLVVSTKDGKVMIRGMVDTGKQEKDIEKMVKNMEGVKKVDMDVEVMND